MAAALEGGVVTNALNVPAVAAEDLERLGPFLPLAADLGALAIELAGGRPKRLDFRYLGELAERDTRLLTVAALNGAFRGRVEEAVNYVNAPLVAEERGIEVREEQRRASRHFKNLITRHRGRRRRGVHGRRARRSGRDDEPRLVRALGYEVEIALEPLMLFVVNDDRPGRIGRLGTILGEAGVNIANMAVSRNRPRSRALMVLTLDNPDPRRRFSSGIRAEPGLHRPTGDRARTMETTTSRSLSWPEPVERVAAALREAASRRGSRSSPRGRRPRPTPRRRPARRSTRS